MPNLISALLLTVFFISFSGVSYTPASAADTAANTSYHTPKKTTDDFIPWIIDRRLSWDDFLSAPKKNGDAVASTATSLGIAYQVTNAVLSYQITCNFSKKKSWGLVKTPYILAHEQGHFDITEIAARKLNEALAKYKFNRKTFKQDITAIYQKAVQSKERMQEAYDKETDHSRKKGRQRQWLTNIDNMLQDTAPFANYP